MSCENIGIVKDIKQQHKNVITNQRLTPTQHNT